ncbi:MAG: AAA family ATPase [Candidatus Bathyarchaeia archaeon]
MSSAEQFFSEEFSAELVDREKEKQLLKEYLQDVLHGKKRALYIHGSPGIGKTTTTKHIVNQFEDAYSAEVIYKNSANTTPNQVLHEIHNRVCREVEGKIPSKTLVQQILNHRLRDDKFILILVLDNFDRMQHVDDLLWDFHSISQKLPHVGLFLISTSEVKLRHLVGERLYDRLNPETYEFAPYSADRLLEIIQARIKQAYAKNFVSAPSLTQLCEFAAERGGNVRRLFSLFLDALELLPRNSSKISSEIEDIIERERTKEVKSTLDEMRINLPAKFELLRLIDAAKDRLDTGAVISLANANGLHVSARTIQNYLVDFERMKLVKLERVRKGQGHSQLIRPMISLDSLK